MFRRSRSAAILVTGFTIVAVICILSSSQEQDHNSLTEQELWNPATYYNVFGGDDTPGPAVANEWSRSKVREELHKLILAVQSLKGVIDNDQVMGTENVDALKDQQNNDNSNIGSNTDELSRHQQAQQDYWSSFSQTLSQISQKEVSDMVNLRSQLVQTLDSIRQQSQNAAGPRAQALSQARADVASAQQVLAEITRARDSLKDIEANAVSQFSGVNSLYSNAKTVRTQVENAIKSAQKTIDDAQNQATGDIAAVTKGVNDLSNTHADRFAAIGKRLDNVNAALNALTLQQSAIHDDIVNGLAASAKTGSDAVSAFSASSLNDLSNSKTSIDNQLASINSGLSALSTMISTNTIESTTRDKLAQLQLTMNTNAGDQSVTAAKISSDVSEVVAKVADVSSLNAETLKKANALSAVMNAMRSNNTAELQALQADVVTAFNEGPLAVINANKASINTLTQNLKNLTSTNTVGINAVNNLVKNLQTSYAAQVKSLADSTAKITKDVTDQSAKFVANSNTLSTNIDAAVVADAKSFNATVKLINEVQTKLDGFVSNMNTLSRPLGPKGPTGIVGPVGPAGEVGPTGDQGPQGAKGLNGLVGPIGAPGPRGDMGAKGPQGLQGVKGAEGAVGIQGPQGPDGLDGAVGVQGPPGVTGAAGAEGPVGETGAVGVVGPVGLPGGEGVQGAPGPQGPTGQTGPRGKEGNAGIEGPVGPTGLPGATGPAGSQGAQGVTGSKGPRGDTGPAGNQGPVGRAGEPGFAGMVGKAGNAP